MKALLYLAFAITALQATAIAHATPFTETFYLLSNSGGSGGYGNFTLNVAPPAIGQIAYGYQYLFPNPGYLVQALNIYPTIGPPLPIQGSPIVLIVFTNGQLTGIEYDGGTGAGFHYQEQFYSPSDGLTYTDSYLSTNQVGVPYPTINDSGIISLTPAAVTSTPEPPSLALLLSGLLAGFAVLRRERFRPTAPATSTR